VNASHGGAGTGGDPDSRLGAVVVGRYVLEVGSSAGTIVGPSTAPVEAEAASLARALTEQKPAAEPEKTPTEAIGDLVDEAATATAKVERALAIGKGAAQGAAFDPAQLGLEADALLDLLERLDREGRAKEALRLARTLSKLYSLLRRWMELLRALRTALRAGEILGDLKAIGWAKHELGTLQLAGGDIEGAKRSLTEAREIRERLGDPADLAATEHNLRVLSQRVHGLTRQTDRARRTGRPRAPRLSPALVVVGAVLFCAGIAGGAVVGGSGSGGGGKATTITAKGAADTETTTVTETASGPGGVTSTVTVTATEPGGGPDTKTVTETETETIIEVSTVTVPARGVPAKP
jgi:hypothetical protein